MNWFSYSVYQILKVITKVLLRIYYPRTTVINREGLKFTQPTIVACSHPNTMMDPLHVASRTKKPLYFLANADLFATKFGNWFYSTFFCIPIKRKMDDRTKHIDNIKSFDRVIEFLGNGGCLWIAPEGGSFWGRHWLRLKTGTARIALLTEQANEYDLGLQILPVGLNYEAPNYFRTRLVINVGDPILVQEFKEDNEKNFRKTVTLLTETLEEKLQELEIATNDEEEDSILEKVERMIQNELPASTKAGFFRGKGLLKKMQELELNELKQQIDDYFTVLKKYKLSDRAVMQFSYHSTFRKAIEFIWIILGFPLFLYGTINNILPIFIPYYIPVSRQTYIGYKAIVQVIIGLFTFPLFYTLQTIVFHQYFQINWLTWVYLATLIPSGLFAWHYGNYFKLFRKRLRLKRMSYEEQDGFRQQRKSIITQLLKLS